MEVLRGRSLLPVQDEKENNILVKGNWKDGGGIPSASKPGLQSRKALSNKQVTLLGAENPGLSAKTPGPAAKTPGRRALGDITNAGQGSKAAKTPKLKAEGLKPGQTPARKALGNITNQGPAQLQKKAEQGGLAEKPAEVKKVESTRERKAVRRTANGRRIVPGVNLHLTAEEKAKIREMASSLSETGVEHVHVTGRQLEEMRTRDDERVCHADSTGNMRRFLGVDVDYLALRMEALPTPDLPHFDDESRLEPVDMAQPPSPDFKATARSSPVSTFDDNDLMRASLDVLPSLSDRELEFDWQDGDMDFESDAD